MAASVIYYAQKRILKKEKQRLRLFHVITFYKLSTLRTQSIVITQKS